MKHLLWIDACAAGTSGVLLLALRSWISPWYAIGTEILVFMGVVSLVYSAFGLYLASRPVRPPGLVRTLIAANFAWASTCLVGAIVLAGTASFFGIGALVLEAIFVAGLAMLERKYWPLLVGPRAIDHQR